jgi:hypothetical protein
VSRPAGGVVTEPQVSPADRWISRAAISTVAALAGLAGAISYSHMRQLAAEQGQAGWHAHAFPLSVDGLEVVASLVLLAGDRSGRRPGWLPWAALVIGTAGSLAANVATAGPSTISRIIAGWPALALLIAVKLLPGMLNHPAVTRPIAAQPGTGREGHKERSGLAVAVQVSAAHSPVRTGSAAREALSRHDERARQGAGRIPEAEPPPVTVLAPSIAHLLPAARAAREELHREGHRLTRDALAVRLRDSGHPIRNSRITPLLQALRSETATTSPV